jgi:predicted nuclease of predicted toxin-antitoxin system
VRFLVDHQLPAALARFLEARGHVARHVIEVSLETATDRQIFGYAKANDFVVVSKDQDFLELATRYADSPPLVWVRLGNCRKVALVAGFDAVLMKLVEALEAGEKVIEVR